MTDTGKLQCKYCDYKGHKPMMTRHLFMAHNIVDTE